MSARHYVRGEVLAARPPPRRPLDPIGWLAANLFSSPIHIAATVLAVAAIALVLPPALDWAIFDAVWVGDNRAACVGPEVGACWAFVWSKIGQFVHGLYPVAERWRVDAFYVLFAAGLIPMAIPRVPFKRANALYLVLVLPIVSLVLLHGGVLGLREVPTSQWGGLMVTVIVASVGIATSIPLGVLLALGRRSKMPVIRMLCIGFIEFWRGIPLITVLFMSSVMLPLFLPPGVDFDKLLRALIGISLYASAYMAEAVRGGLQSLPRGQYEAASSLGLGYWSTMRKVILPQALRVSIPGIVNMAIALLKDTSLVIVIGLFDLLGIIQSSFADSTWASPATPATGYIFAALVYWVLAFGVSRYSLFLERRLDVGRRH